MKRLGLGLVLLSFALTSVAKKRDADPVAAVEFSPPGGVFSHDVSLRLTPVDRSGVVRFTLDGSEPIGSSPIATNAIVLTNSILVRAAVFHGNARTSDAVVQSYTLVDSGLTNLDSNLPLIIINSSGRQIMRDRKITVSVRIVNGGASRSALMGPADFDGFALCRLHGRSSLRYPKRSFNLKTLDEFGEPAKAPLLGLPKEFDWVLYAPYADKTLMRSVLAYELSNQMGRYATRTRFVEVFVSQSSTRLTGRDYLGLYVLEEKIKSDKYRVNIEKLEPGDLTEPDVSGGYIFKKDHIDRPNVEDVNIGGFPQGGGGSSTSRPGYPTGPGGFPGDPAGFLPAAPGEETVRTVVVTSRSSSRSMMVTNLLGVVPRRIDLALSNRRYLMDEDDRLPSDLIGFRTAVTTNQFYFVEPEADELNAVQRAWLADYVNEFERALYGPDFTNAAHGYWAFIDPGSFIDYHLLVEATKNVDGFRFSTYYYKDRNDWLRMGPAWDWNLSFGNANGKQGWLPEYWLWPQLDDREYSWFRRLFDDPDFGQLYVDRWAELRRGVFATPRILSRIDALARLLDEAQQRNFKRWPILGMNVNPNWYVGDTYADEVAWMKQWITKRLDWIDRQFVAAPKVTLESDAADSSKRLNLQAPIGTVFYTLDGTDPRAPGGAVASGAHEFRAPVAARSRARVVARAKLESRWSSPTTVETDDLNPSRGGNGDRTR